MPSKAQLTTQKNELLTRLDALAADETKTVDEKETEFKTLNAEFEAWSAAVESSESASRDADMRAKLAGFGGDVKDAAGRQVTKFEAPGLNKFMVKAYADELLTEHESDLEKIFEAKAGHRAKYDMAWELGTKTNGVGPLESNNLMGEGLFGTTAATAAGQTPFLPGAFGPGVQPQWLPGIVEQLFYELTIADLISSFATTAPNISYLTESVANFESAATAEGALYPWSSEAVARSYAQVGKIANAMTITDEAVADAPTLFNFIQGRLLFGLQRQEEVQLLAGTGYPGVGGLLSFASSFTNSSSSSIYGATSATGTNVNFPPAGTNGAGAAPVQISSLPYGRHVVGPNSTYPGPLLTSLHLKDAMVDIELAVFKRPTAIVMHPRDWQRLETAQDANQQFMNTSYFGNVYGVSRGPVKTLWGVPVVTTPLFPVGTVLTGWFDPQSIQVARRQGISMQMTNSNGTDFVQGYITMRAEERLGLLVYRPPAFQLINLATS